MRVRSFHIDGYGLFSGVSVDSLSPGLSIFLGNNEAGKSTCLEFLRTMLTGYPDLRTREGREGRERAITHPHSGQAGGSLDLETHKHGIVHLTRRPGSSGGIVTLTDAQGQALDLGLLDQWLAGVTREVYRSVFGFSLSELQTFESLNSEGVRHALYGASFGMGLRSPGQVFKALDDQMEGLFKGQGSKPPLNAALREWELLRKQVQVAEEECARFDALTLEKGDTEAALNAVRQRKIFLSRQRHDEERRLNVWGLWDEWRGTRSRLERLEDVVDTFPQDGPGRLERAHQNRQAAARQAQLQLERCQRTQNLLDSAPVDAQLLRLYPQLQTLAERKTSFRQARNALLPNAGAQQRARADLDRLLADLGPQWTCERIRATNRSLFARGELERQATEMQAAEQAHVANTAALEKANRAVERAEHDLELAQATLALLPIPVAALDDTGRDDLRRTLAQIEDARQRLPEKKQALQMALAAFARTINPLRLRPGPKGPALDRLADEQEKALELAEKAQVQARESKDAALAARQAHEGEEAARARLDRLRAEQRVHQGPDRRALDMRAAALRSLRHLHSLYSVEQDRLAEVASRLKVTKAPDPMKSLPLLCIGILLMFCGAAVLLARWQMGITTLAITPQLVMPITLWSGYLIILTGVGFLAGGIPRSGPEAQRHAAEVGQLHERHTASRLRMTELEAQIQEQCVVAEVTNADPITLDATELLLEREREQCVTDERLSLEMVTLEAELSAAREKSQQAQSRNLKSIDAVKRSRLDWHNFMLDHLVDNIPDANAVSTFFTRVETARVALVAVAALETEVSALEECMESQLRAARVVPPVAEVLAPLALLPEGEEAAAEPPAPDMQRVLDAIRRVLDNCREADAAEEERLKAAAVVHSTEINADRASTAQGEAMDTLRRSEDTLGASREAWSSSLEELGLGLELSPGLVREALDCMERCLGAEAEVARLEDERTRHEHELRAFTTPLTGILEELKRPPPAACGQHPEEDNETDWTALLDGLLGEAQHADEMSRQHKLLTTQLTEQQDELRAAEGALADAVQEVQTLLDLACTGNAEEFLRLAHIRNQREELRRRMDDLEDALRRAAGDTPLEEFLESFAKLDKEEREAQLHALAAELEALDAEEQHLATGLATLAASLQNLTIANHLAELRQREAELVESMRHMADIWSRHALARHLLAQAKRRFERERQPQVIRTASAIFTAITEGRWQGLTASLEDSTLNVLPPHGEPVSPDVLSRGTQEQMYLAMRLAYIRNHAAHASALPVIMDDILVNFDPQRARRTAEAFMRLTTGSDGQRGQQVLFFTCHPHIADMLQEVTPHSQRFLVENATIRMDA